MTNNIIRCSNYIIMTRMRINIKRIVGLAILISMTALRSLVWSQYVEGTFNVWHNIIGILTLIPIDGIIAGVYGLWSRDKYTAFTIGFLPSTLSLIAPILRNIRDVQGLFRTFFAYGGFAVGMGLMGFGLAERKEKSFFFLGIALWVLTLLMMMGSGI